MTKKHKRSPYEDVSDASALPQKAPRHSRASNKPAHQATSTSATLPNQRASQTPADTAPASTTQPQRMSIEELEQKKMLLPYLDKIEYINIHLRQRGLLPSDPNDPLASLPKPPPEPTKLPTSTMALTPVTHPPLTRQHSDSHLRASQRHTNVPVDRLKMRYPRLYGTISSANGVALSPRIRPINWLLHLIEEIYDDITDLFVLGVRADTTGTASIIGSHSNNDASPRPEEAERSQSSTRLFQTKLVMPFLVRKHVDHTLGLARLADQECLDLLYNGELELDRFPHVALFSMFVRELYDDDTLLFYLVVRHLLQREYGLQLKNKTKTMHSSTTGKPFVASDLIHFEPHPLVPDGSLTVFLTRAGCELVWRRFFSHASDLNPNVKRVVHSAAVLGQYLVQERMASLFTNRSKVPVETMLSWSVDAFRAIPEDIIAQYKYKDDGESLQNLLRLRDTISSDAQIASLLALFSERERVLRNAKIDLLRLERSNTEDNRHRTQLRLLRNQIGLLEQELGHIQSQISATETVVNDVWQSVVSSSPTKSRSKKKPSPPVDTANRSLQHGSKDLPSVLGRFEASIVRLQRTHDIQVKAAAMLAKPWQQQMEELQLRMVIKIQRAYRERRKARLIQQQAREQLAEQIRQRDLKKQQQVMNQKRQVAVMEKDLQRHQARMLAKREQEEAARGAMQQKQQQLLDKVHAEQIHQRAIARNHKRVTKCFGEWTQFARRRKKRRQAHRLFLKFQFLKWRRHYNAFQHESRAAVTIQRVYRRYKEKLKLRKIVQRNKKRQALAARYLRKIQQQRLHQAFVHWTQWATHSIELKANFQAIIHRRQHEWFAKWVAYVVDWRQRRRDAVLLVQRVYRGRLARHVFKQQRRRHRSALSIQCCYRRFRARCVVAERKRIKAYQVQGSESLRRRIRWREAAVCLGVWRWYGDLEHHIRDMAQRRKERHRRSILCDGFVFYAQYKREKRIAFQRLEYASAVKIQSLYRRFKSRVLFLESLRCHRAAIRIQRVVRRYQWHQRVYRLRQEVAAARKLQTAWRRRLASRLVEWTRAQAILLAAYKGDFTATQRAIASGYWYVIDDEGNGIMHMAAAAGHKRVVKLCLRHEMDVNAVNHLGQSPLHLLLANLPPSSFGSMQDAENNRLIEARIQLAAYMIDHGAWHEAQDELGLTPLLLSSAMGQAQAVELLLERSANTDVRSAAGLNAIQLAVEGNHSFAFRTLLASRGFDVPETLRLLHTCAGRGLLDCLKALVEFLAVCPIQDSQWDERDDDGYTPLIYAISSGDTAAVELLLHHGASPDIKDYFGRAPIHFAVSVGVNGCREIVELLTSYDVDVDVKDTDGDSALHASSSSDDQVECTRLLLRFGVSIVANALGNHATHIAARGGALETLKLLVEYGADMNIKNYSGKTALGVARMHAQQRIVEYITQYFASEDVSDDRDEKVERHEPYQDGEEDEEQADESHPERTEEEWVEAVATAFKMGTLAEWTHYVDAATEISFFAKFDPETDGRWQCTWTTPIEFDAALSDAWEVMRGGGPSVASRHKDYVAPGQAPEIDQDVAPRVQYFYHNKRTGKLRASVPPIDYALLQDVVQNSKRHQKLRQKIHRVSDDNSASAMEYMRFFHEFEADSQQTKQQLRAAVVIQRHFRARRTKRMLHALLRENKCAVDLQRAFRGRKARKLAAFKRHEHACASKIQVLYRGHRARTAERDGKREARVLYRKRRLAAAMIQRMYRGHLARRQAYRERVVQKLGPRGYFAWEQARRRARVVRRFKVWDEMELPSEFPGVLFYCHQVTRSCSWEKPKEWRAFDAEQVQERTQLVRWGYTQAMKQAAVRLQSLWRARQARISFVLILKSVRLMKTAEKDYLEDPTHIVKMGNYVLYLHAILHDYDRARPLYGRLVRTMAQRGPDIPFVLFSYAIFLYVTQEDDVSLVEDMVLRAKLVDPQLTKYKMAFLGFFRQSMLQNPLDSESNLNYAACLQWLFDQYDEAIPFYLRAIAANPHKRIAMELFQDMLTRKKQRDKARNPSLFARPVGKTPANHAQQRDELRAQYDSYEVFRRWQVEQAQQDDRHRRQQYEAEQLAQQREQAAKKIQARYRRRQAMRHVNRAKVERPIMLRSMVELADTKTVYDRVSLAFERVAVSLLKSSKVKTKPASAPMAKLEDLFEAMDLALTREELLVSVQEFKEVHGQARNVNVMEVTQFAQNHALLSSKFKLMRATT